MDRGQMLFQQRVQRLNRKHDALSHGSSTRIQPDGLIVAAPSRRRRRVEIRPLMLCAVGFLAFKALLIAHLGTGVYNERVEKLRQGTIVERTGAWIMWADPLSTRIAREIIFYVP